MPKRLKDKQRGAIGARIRERRLRAGLSQEALAEKIHLSSSAVARWEDGRTELPAIKHLTAAAKVFTRLGVPTTVEYLVAGDPEESLKEKVDALGGALSDLRGRMQRLSDQLGELDERLDGH